MPIDEARLKSVLSSNKRTIINSDMFARSAVLVPLIKSDTGSWEILFQVRASHLKRQPGEICFPGGTLDSPQESPRRAARRETCEELGLRPEEVYMWGRLGLLFLCSTCYFFLL